MGSYEIIKLNPEDYYKCNNIWDMYVDPQRTKKWYDELVSGNRIIYVYTEDNEFIGEAALVLKSDDPDYTIPNKRACLSRLIVKREFRNRGIGGILIDHIINVAKSKGYKEISLGVNIDNAAARHLYEKKGFTNIIFEGEDDLGKYMKLLKIL